MKPSQPLHSEDAVARGPREKIEIGGNGSTWTQPVSVVLGLIASVYIGLGFYTLVFETGFSYPVDLRLRWIEQGMVSKGLNPQELTYPEELLPKMILAQRNVRGNYPPWSYATGLFLVPAVDWSTARIYFALLNLVALAGLSYWLYQFGERLGSGFGMLAALSMLAIFSICVCLSYGQYSLIVLGLIILSMVLIERDQMAAAGVVLAIASIKPQLAGLCFLVPLVFPFPFWQKSRFVAGAVAYFAIASFGVALYVNSTPWEILLGTANEAVKFFRLSNNPLIIWSSDLFGFQLGSKILAVLVAGICVLLLAAVRQQRNLLVGFSICTILAMYWSYSRHYDSLLLTIPMIELLSLYRTKRSKLALIAFLLLGVTLWLPVRIGMSRSPEFQLLFAAACTFALGTIVGLESRRGSVAAEASIPLAAGFAAPS